MSKVRVVYREDGGVSVIAPAPKSRRMVLTAEGVEYLEENGIDAGSLGDIEMAAAIRFFCAQQPLIQNDLLEPEPEAQWLDRVFDKAMEPQYDKEGKQVNLYLNKPYDDIDDSELPQSREDRNCWEGEKGNGVRVNTVKAAEIKLDKENRSKIELRKREILEQQAITDLKISGDLPADYA